MSLFINKKKKENNLLRLRLYIAGMVIDRLSDLQKELRNPKIDYIEYIELRNAIELLGAVPEIELSFDGEKYYEALKARREAKENG